MPAIPTTVQYAWHEIARSMFIHFGPATWQGQEYDDGSVPLDRIHPEQLDADQWCRAALSFGARRIVFVAKHTGGFCWWQTQTTPYSVRNTPWRGGKGDVLADLARACEAHGITLGIYIYPGDRNFTAYIGGGGKTENPALQAAYNEVFRTQLTEVLTRYGTISEVWFDGSCVIDVADILAAHARQAVIFQGPQATIRWCGTERGLVPDPAWSTLSQADLSTGTATVMQSNPEGAAWAPLEVDTTLYDHFWFWSQENAKRRKSLAQLMRTYYQSVGRGCVLLLNVCPDTSGLIPEADMALLAAFGAELARRFASPVLAGKGEGYTVDAVAAQPVTIDHVVLMEDYRHGERVRAYRVEARTARGWEVIARGQHIGRKHIHVMEPVTVQAVRVVVEHAVGIPVFRSIACYRTDAEDLSALMKAQHATVLAYDPASGTWTLPGHGQPVFCWEAGQAASLLAFEVDLSAFVPEPGQYELLFVAEGSVALEVVGLEALLEGVPTPGVLHCVEPGKKYLLTRTSAVQGDAGKRTGIRGAVRCADGDERGSLLIQKLL